MTNMLMMYHRKLSKVLTSVYTVKNLHQTYGSDITLMKFAVQVTNVNNVPLWIHSYNLVSYAILARKCEVVGQVGEH